MAATAHPHSQAQLTQWACQRCTLLNSLDLPQCSACEWQNPLSSGNSPPRRGRTEGLLSKFKRMPDFVLCSFLLKAQLHSSVPTISIASAVEKIDSAIETIANAVQSPRLTRVTGGGGGGIYPATTPSPTPSYTSPSPHHPSTPVAGQAGTMVWQCIRCGLHQPISPVDLKCPLCRAKCHPSRGNGGMAASKSMV